MAEQVEREHSNENDNVEFLNLLDIIKEQNERIEKVERALNAKDNMNKTLQTLLMAKEKLIKFLKQKLKTDIEQLEANGSDDAKTRTEIWIQNLKGKVAQPETETRNPVDSDSDSDLNFQDNFNVALDAAIKVAGIPMVVIQLLKSMKNRDLLHNCRLVSREWRDFSTPILRKRKTFRLGFCRPAGTASQFSLFPEPTSGNKPRFLEELTSFLTTCKTFPCANFIFYGNVNCDDAQEFLSQPQIAGQVKGLKLTDDQNLDLMRKLLVEKIPRLESLELERFVPEGQNSLLGLFPQLGENPNDPDPAPEIPSKIFGFPQEQDSSASQPQLLFLTSLKLGVGNSAALVKEILDAAPNLQEISGFEPPAEDRIEWLQKRIHILKGLKINLGADFSRDKIDKLFSMMRILQKIQQNPQQQLHLTVLNVNYSGLSFFNDYRENAPALCSLISQLLGWSPTSLKRVKLAPDAQLHSRIQWPKMERVEKLTLAGAFMNEFVYPFPAYKIPEIFPSLHTLHFKDIQGIMENDFKMLRNHPPISTVKVLVVFKPNPEILTGFLPLLPNVTSLELSLVQHDEEEACGFPHLAPIIWQRINKGLKSLQIKFDGPKSSSDEIDAGFTGMDQETCKFIRTLGGAQFQGEEVNKFRVNPSILNLKELEHLFLPLGFTENENPNPTYDDDDDDDSGTGKAIFISFQYAFKLMPKLRVFHGTDH